MVQTIKRDELKTLLYEKKKHDTGNVVPILPFLSKRTKAIRQFNKVLGEFIRSISGVEFNEKALGNKDFYHSKEDNVLSEYIASKVDFADEDDASDFVRFLNEYLFNQEEIKPIHPYLFNYIKLDKSLKNEFGKYAQFMNETLIKNHPDIKEIFSNKDSDDILTELILEKMTTLEKKKGSSETHNQQYQPLLGTFTELYQEDIIYLSKYKDYFLTSFPLLTHYYVFMYVCQLLLKFEQFTEADYQKIQPLYFALDWEAISKRRKAADDIEGFSYLKEKLVHLFPHIHTISHLCHNSFNDMKINEDNYIQFIPYSDLYAEIKSKGIQYEEAFLNDLKQWIRDYCVWAKINILDDSTDIPEAFRVLFNCLKEGMSTGVCVKYGQNLEDLGSSQFLKTRGSLGQVLNIKHDFLLLLTAVSVKDQRIPLNDLFVEFEKRGIAFDRYSKKEVISLFDNLNIIDKKSDSGDAQYVKPIL
jgi:DNA phosphorothioation-dependent restriction protein DptG